MIINGMQKLTLLDYPGCVAGIIFTSGCNFSCPYCQNSSLIKQGKTSIINEEEIFDYLIKRKNIIDGLVISGGEPTIQKGLKEFIIKVKKIGLKVKLDTNGYRPDVLKDLLNNNLLDYIAMDIKDIIDDYSNICGLKNINGDLIKESINIIKNSNIDFEFRTTIIKKYHNLDKIKKIIKLVGNKSKYYIQNFQSSADVIDKSLTSFSKEEIKQLENDLIKYPNVIIRG